MPDPTDRALTPEEMATVRVPITLSLAQANFVLGALGRMPLLDAIETFELIRVTADKCIAVARGEGR